MAVTNRDQEKDAMADVAAPGADDGNDRDEQEKRERAQEYHARQAAAKEEGAAGFFSIYKSGQGYWTRMGTAGSIAVLLVYTAHFLYTTLKVKLPGTSSGVIAGIVAAFGLAVVGLVYWVMNRPTNVDFLIATDSEMRKVNWTSRKELIGSTKVVVVFMFLIAAFLFVVDLIFSSFFYLIGVMKISPFLFGQGS